MKNKCIFCQITSKKIKAKVISETKHAMCFLDANPIAEGHCLIIPKKHFSDLFDIKSDVLEDIMGLTKKVSKLMKLKLSATGINILHASGKDAQQSIMHFHIHLVPRFKNDGLDTWPKSHFRNDSTGKTYARLIV